MEDIEDYYIDQAPTSTTYGYRTVSSVYTPEGIRRIDSQYIVLIKNINERVKQIYSIVRRPAEYSEIKTRIVHKSYNYYTFYEPLGLKEFNGFSDIRVEWENGTIYDFHYGPIPIFNSKTKKTNQKLLKESIEESPNLHSKIKENLLVNLEAYLK